MQSSATTPDEYLNELPEERRVPIRKLRDVILKNLPKGFVETMGYGMMAYVVPHSLYPKGYHCNSKLPLPFINVASQKNFIALYHMGIYADKALCDWFIQEYAKAGTARLDMGKSCIRFKKPEHIPFELIGKLAAKITPAKWIEIYEKNFAGEK